MDKILICGGRDFNNYNALEHFADLAFQRFDLNYESTQVISGGARGADSFGEQFAKNHNIDIKKFVADWKTYGKAAGPIRNRMMIDYLLLDEDKKVVLAFVSEKSVGTKNTIALANKNNIPVITVKYDGDGCGELST